MATTKFKSFFNDFRKHVVQAFATLLAGFVIGALLGGAKVISNQEELSRNQELQTVQIERLQEGMDSLSKKDYNMTELSVKLDSVYATVRDQKDDIENINVTLDRIFNLFR